jgi:DNA modification methylase
MIVRDAGAINPSDATESAPLVDLIAVHVLRPNPRNPRTHSKKQTAKIAQSISTCGFLNPIIVDKDNVVLAGHGRLEAARSLGLARVPIIRVNHLTDAQKRAYLIADNRIAEEAGWDRQLLAIELEELVDVLPAEGLDVSLTGFEAAEIDLLLADMSQPAERPEDCLPPVPRVPTTQRGDLWLLGKHRLLCDDAQKAAPFTKLMKGMTAAAVFCDPPYNLRIRSIGGRGKIRHPEFAFASGEMQSSEFVKFLSKTLGNGVAASREGAIHFICMDWRHINELIAVGRKTFGAMLNLVVWNKSNAGQGSFYRSQHELIGVFQVGALQHRNNIELGRHGRNRSNVWTYAGINTFGRDRMKSLAAHPTVKPTALVADALLDCTSRGDIVLDQFAGSGTIFLAAEKVGRIACGMEVEPRFIDVAITRWQNSTKLEAVLANDGRAFDDVARERAEIRRHGGVLVKQECARG